MEDDDFEEWLVGKTHCPFCGEFLDSQEEVEEHEDGKCQG
jgi:hypothetical protein